MLDCDQYYQYVMHYWQLYLLFGNNIYHVKFIKAKDMYSIFFDIFRKCDGLKFDFAVQNMNVQYLKHFYGIPQVIKHRITKTIHLCLLEGEILQNSCFGAAILKSKMAATTVVRSRVSCSYIKEHTKYYQSANSHTFFTK